MPQKQEKPTSHTQKISDFIDPGGGATSRPRENPQLILPTKHTPPIMSSEKFSRLIEKFKTIGKLDREDFNSSSEMCRFLDFYNNTVTTARQNKYEKDLTDLNEYYWKLWIRAIQENR